MVGTSIDFHVQLENQPTESISIYLSSELLLSFAYRRKSGRRAGGFFAFGAQALVVVHPCYLVNPFLYQLAHDIRSSVSEEITGFFQIVADNDKAVVVQHHAMQFSGTACSFASYIPTLKMIV